MHIYVCKSCFFSKFTTEPFNTVQQVEPYFADLRAEGFVLAQQEFNEKEISSGSYYLLEVRFMHMIGLQQVMQQWIIYIYILWFQCGSMWRCVSCVLPFNKHSTITFSCKASDIAKRRLIVMLFWPILTQHLLREPLKWQQTMFLMLSVLLHLVPATGRSWVNYVDIGYSFSEHMSRHVNTHVTISCMLFFVHFIAELRLHAYLCPCLFNVLYGTWYYICVCNIYIHTYTGYVSIYGLVATQFGKHIWVGAYLISFQICRAQVLDSAVICTAVRRDISDWGGNPCCLWYLCYGWTKEC